MMLYLHLPFCRHHCPYCDFFVVAGASQDLQSRYVSALIRDFNLADRYFDRARSVSSMFLGGGTPSHLSPELLSTLMEALHKFFAVEANAEITLEINPEDITRESAQLWQRLGINRLSLGVQSLQAQELTFLERGHQAQDVKRAIGLLSDLGFENISADVMFNLPSQRDTDLRTTLDELLKLPLSHISAYNLTLEPRTRLYARYHAKGFDMPSDETQAQHFLLLRQHLEERGFAPYEISNFARAPRFESVHNQGYWNGREYLGLGVSAHSFSRRVEKCPSSSLTAPADDKEEGRVSERAFMRFWWPRELAAYLEGRLDPQFERLSPYEHLSERLFTGLRQTCGVNLPALYQDVGLDSLPTLENELGTFERHGWLVRKGPHLRLTEAGLLISDSLFERVHQQLCKVG